MKINDRHVGAAGISKVSGTYVDVYTDVRDREDIDELTEVFDQAVEFWCEYFQIDPSKVDGWKISCFVILERDKFVRSGVYPADLPPFPAGYQRGFEMWLYVQRGDYYTRHLFLHEGTHAFMHHFLGGVGGPWFAEGMAELLAVHRWKDNRLEMNYRHNLRQDVPFWGRVKIVQDEVADESPLTLSDVMAAQVRDFQNLRWYAWAWAACRFFDSHPRHQAAFRQLRDSVGDQTVTFSQRFWESLRDDHQQLEREWNLYLRELDYGINVEAIFVSEIGKNDDGSFELATNRSWQETGIQVEAGDVIDITASGNFVLKWGTRPWRSEANGITLEYFAGKPLGRLVAAIQNDEQIHRGEFTPIDIGARSSITAQQDGKLFLKINDSPALYYDNEGSLQLEITKR